MVRVLRIRATALATVAREARAAYPAECCGALVGPAPGNDAARHVYAAMPAPAETGRRHFRLGPETVRRLEDRAAADGLVVLGYYHSHPDTDPTPSAADLEGAWPWYVYLVQSVSVEGGERAAWLLDEDRSRFRRIEIQEVEG